MLGRFSSWFACTLLKVSVLSDADRAKLSSVIMQELGALPVKEIIETDAQGTLYLLGKPADKDVLTKLRHSAKATLNSYALNLIHDQVTWEAIKLGVHTAKSNPDLTFSRAAIWYGQQERKILTAMAIDELPQ